MSFPSPDIQAKEFYSCKESCTWYQAFEQLQCATCTQEQLSLKLWSELFAELDIWSFSWTLKGETIRGNTLMGSSRPWTPPTDEQLQHFKVLCTPQVGPGRGHQFTIRSSLANALHQEHILCLQHQQQTETGHLMSSLCSQVPKVISVTPVPC